jgi:hypothetical protein
VFLLIVFTLPVVRELCKQTAIREYDPEQLTGLRRRSLRLGHFIALLAIVEWTIAGIVYPLAMYVGGQPLTLMDNAHFFGSLLLCGLVAAAYPYFFATAFSVRVIYPAFFRPFHLRSDDVADMNRLDAWTWLYLVIGLLVPMLAVVLMVTLGGQDHRIKLAIVSGSSLAGFVLLVALARYLQTTMATLRQVTGVADKRET